MFSPFFESSHAPPGVIRRRRTRRLRGFTLIELLVVIAILAILAAILFPVFSRARENARKATCQSNLKQIAQGIMQYTQDFDEKYPNRQGTGTGLADTTMVTFLQPYLKSRQIFICPSAIATETNASNSTKDYTWRADFTSAIDANRDRGTYGMNYYLNGAPTANVGQAINKYSRPTQTPMLFDCSWFEEGAISLNNPIGNANRHLDAINVAFADGHVKAYPIRSAFFQLPADFWLPDS